MIRSASVALLVALLAPLFAASDAFARPRTRGDHVWEREPELVGYRVSVEPLLRYYRCGRGERCPGGDVVATDVVVWKLRTILRGPGGEEIEGRFNERGRESFIRDREVSANRWWRRSDVPAQTRILRDPEVALRAFLDWSRSDDPRTLDPELGDRPHRPDPIHRPDPYDPPHDGPGRPYDDGYGACERALLERGHRPDKLQHCRGVEEQCALSLIARGHNPSQLDNCRHVEPTCALALIERGHNPNQLEHCARVDDRCAVGRDGDRI
ncbi:MAG TPA: hypothetical protein PK095_25905 [Myxococcota bacterium]|nr:hypothetical protein [Myxococcota bacterium]